MTLETMQLVDDNNDNKNLFKNEIENKIIKEGELDYSRKEILVAGALMGPIILVNIAAAWMYIGINLNGEGTQNLPVGGSFFNKEFGAFSAYSANLIFAIWYTMDTLVKSRDDFYAHKLAAKHGLTPKVPMLKLGGMGLALISSILCGIMNALIASSNESAWLLPAVLFVNTILGYVGSSEFISLVANSPKLLVNTTKEFLAASCLEKSKKVANFFVDTPVHGIAQLCNLASLPGFWLDTIKEVAPTKALSAPLGTFVFAPFGALSVKVTYDTINDMLSTLKSLPGATLKAVCNKEERNLKKFMVHLVANLIAIPLIIIGYALAYVSSNTTLALNAAYGWKQSWNIIPATIGATLFNGFGFLCIISSLKTFTTDRLTKSSEKITAERREGQAVNFFKKYPANDPNTAYFSNTSKCCC